MSSATNTIHQAIAALSACVADRRLALLQRVLEQRTRYVTVCLEDIFQPQNASAVLRSCEALGVQDVHVVEDRNSFAAVEGVSLSAHKWLTLHRYRKAQHAQPTAAAIAQLRKQGYRIVATSPHVKAASPASIDLSKGRIALLFGTELTGLSEAALAAADEFLSVPMFGFVESYNISVCAAISLYDITQRLRAAPSLPWQLLPAERDELLLEWLKKTVRSSEEILRRQDLWNEG
ncbi:MAG: RNA methyltransferase [Prevotellaceae bacterium]|jgi:tRNA (guanosine-2'-O-)-methyltransferase|nr:RNA methyltransferase [Prevotellaceae bacterium]